MTVALNVTLPLTLIEDVAIWQPGMPALSDSIVRQLADVILESAGRSDLSGMAPDPAGQAPAIVQCTDPACWDHQRRHHHPRNPLNSSPWSRTGTAATDYIDPEPPVWAR